MKRLATKVTKKVTEQVCRACLACLLGATMGSGQ